MRVPKEVISWIKRTRSLRHDIYEVFILLAGAGLLIYGIIKCYWFWISS